MNRNLSSSQFPSGVEMRRVTSRQVGDDMRDVAAGWIIDNAEKRPNAHMLEGASEEIADIYDPDDPHTVQSFVRDPRPWVVE